MLVFIDIETVPGQTEAALTHAKASVKPPASLKKPESITSWWATEAAAAGQEAHRKQSLDGGLHGEIISVAACTDTGQEWVRCRAKGESEAELLSQFFAQVEAWQKAEADKIVGNASAWPLDPLFPVAFNAQFDFGFLWRRAVVLGLHWPDWLPKPMARVGKDYGDPMTLWAGFGGRVSLDSICTALGLASPKDGGIDGSQVYDRWLLGHYADIAAYNLRDAQAVYKLWCRLHMRGGL